MGIQVIKAGGGGSAGLNLAGGVALSASLVSVVDAFANVSPLQLATASIGLNAPTFLTVPNWTVTLGIKDGFSSQQTVAVASLGTGVFRLIANKYTINNTAAQTGSVTGYFLNATETALNGITHNLMDLQVGGVSKFKVANGGTLTTDGNIQINGGYLTFSSLSRIRCTVDSNIVLFNNAINNFNLLQLGGTTSSFPAIKRNGTGIDFRLADDSAFCDINAKTITANTNLNVLGTSLFSGVVWSQTVTDLRLGTNSFGTGITIASATADVTISTSLTLNSTTKGFLPPRMTTAQVNAIVTPAEGLVVFNTTISHLCVYQAAAWVKLSHTPM